MKDRIKALRKAAGLTQSEFGERIGVKGNTITTYETGARIPSEAVIRAICREFHASEDWLRDGKEPMYTEAARDQQIMDFVADAMRGESDNFKRRLISVLARLDESEWAILEKRLREIIGDKKGD